MSRKLAEGWEVGTLFLRPPKEPLQFGAIRHEVFVKAVHRGQEWLVLQKDCAPSSCFAEPAAPDALTVDERVYVDCPKAPARGWMVVEKTIPGYQTKGFWRVRPEHGAKEYHVPRAAIHREGPQQPPPDEGAVFLGRHESPRGNSDMWRLPSGKFCVNDFVAWSPKEIEGPSNLADDWRPLYRDALARARALGLVEAEAERAEAKFQVGQCIGDGSHVERISERKWLVPTNNVPAGWFYKFQGWRQQPWAAEHLLKPHAPVLTASQEALRPGDVVESIEIPVGTDGVPFDRSLLRFIGPGEIDTILLTRDSPNEIRFADGELAHPQNLRLVKAAEPEEERAPA